MVFTTSSRETARTPRRGFTCLFARFPSWTLSFRSFPMKSKWTVYRNRGNSTEIVVDEIRVEKSVRRNDTLNCIRRALSFLPNGVVGNCSRIDVKICVHGLRVHWHDDLQLENLHIEHVNSIFNRANGASGSAGQNANDTIARIFFDSEKRAPDSCCLFHFFSPDKSNRFQKTR